MINPSKCYLDLANHYGVGKYALNPVVLEGYIRGNLGSPFLDLVSYVRAIPIHLEQNKLDTAGFCLGRIHLMLR